MGLLDSFDDPGQVGLLSLGLRLMSTPGKFGQALGIAGQGALGDMTAVKDRLQKDALQKAFLKKEEMATTAQSLPLWQQVKMMELQGLVPPGTAAKMSGFPGDATPSTPAQSAQLTPFDAGVKALAQAASQGAPGPTLQAAALQDKALQAPQSQQADTLGVSGPGMPQIPAALLQQARFLQAVGKPQDAYSVIHNYLSDLPKYEAKDQLAISPDGKLVMQRGNTYGGNVPASYAPAEDTAQVDLGGKKVLVGNKTGGQVFSGNVTNTPYQAAEIDLRGGQLGLERQKFNFESGGAPNAIAKKTLESAGDSAIKELVDKQDTAAKAAQGNKYIDTMSQQLRNGIYTGQAADYIVGALNSLPNIVLPQGTIDKLSRTQIFDKDAINAVGQSLKATFGARPAASEFMMLLNANANKKLQPDAIEAILDKARQLNNVAVQDYADATTHFRKNGNLIGYTPSVVRQPEGESAPAVLAPKVKTPDDYARIPSGVQYYDPEGNLRTKK